MKKLCVIILFVLSLHPKIVAQDSLVVVFWNMENFFDYTDQGGGEADKEFSSGGSRHWTGKRFYAKCDAIAKSIMWIADTYGRMPDVPHQRQVYPQAHHRHNAVPPSVLQHQDSDRGDQG